MHPIPFLKYNLRRNKKIMIKSKKVAPIKGIAVMIANDKKEELKESILLKKGFSSISPHD